MTSVDHTGRDGYVAAIREKIGHDLLLLPAVSVHIRDDEGRLLLGQKLDSGQWGTVGGAVEPGESPRDAAVREAREETGLHVEVMNVVDVLGGADFGVTYANGDECSYVSIVVDARVVGGTLRPDGMEIVRCAWFSIEEIPTLDLMDISRAVLTGVGAL
jgi:8-oxo-dGTP pyrophosphatase MutT (NUDIX family)